MTNLVDFRMELNLSVAGLLGMSADNTIDVTHPNGITYQAHTGGRMDN